MEFEDFGGIKDRFKCRKCKVLVEASPVYADDRFFRCPCCKIIVRGQAAQNMLVEYAGYEAKVIYIQKTFARRPWLRTLSAEELHERGLQLVEEIVEPSYPFFIDLVK